MVEKIVDMEMRRAGFDKVPNRIARSEGEFRKLSDFAYRVYVYLHSQSKEFNPTQERMAKAFNVSKPKMQRAFRELKESGFLDQPRDRRKGGERRYIYLIYEKPEPKEH